MSVTATRIVMAHKLAINKIIDNKNGTHMQASMQERLLYYTSQY